MSIDSALQEKIATQVVDAVYKVHYELGPGLLESTYQACLAYELASRGIHVKTELDLPVKYKDVYLDCGYRIDMLIADCIIIENKTVEQVQPIHMAQVLTYLKLSGHSLGFLINWNVRRIKNGIQRVVNNHPEKD